MSALISKAMKASRSSAVDGDTHEAIAILLRRQLELKESLDSGSCRDARLVENAVDVLKQRIKPLLQGLASNVFEALKISESAEKSEAKKSYRKLALKYHPDKSQGTTELFHLIQDAFERFQSGKNLKKKGSSNGFASRFQERQQQERRNSNASSRNFSQKGGSGSGSGRRAGPMPMQAPQNMRMVDNSSTSITVGWDAPANAASQVSSYELHYKEADDREWCLASNSLVGTSCQKHNLKPATSYRFRVRALSSVTGEWGPFCGTLSVVTMGSVPARPTILRALANPKLMCIEVQWEAGVKQNNASSEDRYVLEWREKNKKMLWVECEPSSEYEASSCQRMIRDLKATKQYQFRVRAKNATGYGPWSAIKDAQSTKVMPPSESKRRERKLKVLRCKPTPLKDQRPDERLELHNWATWDNIFESENAVF